MGEIMSLSTYIQNLRKDKNLSKRELAKQLGVSAATIVRIENGITTNPSQSLIKKLALYLNQSVIEVTQAINYEETPICLAAHVYGCYLFNDNWFVQNFYTHINPDGKKFKFSIKAIKKRNPQNIMLVDQYDLICQAHETVQQVVSRAIFQILQLQNITVKQYTLVFTLKQKDIYDEISTLKINTPFKFNIVLLDTKNLQIVETRSLMMS